MTSVQNDDGSTTTTYDDGSSKTDYSDGSSMTMYADGSVYNQYPDGSHTYNDVNGNPISQSGPGEQHAGGGEQHQAGGEGHEGGGEGHDGGPATPVDGTSVEDVMPYLEGAHGIIDLAHAALLFGGEGGEVVIGAIEPIGSVLQVAIMLIEFYEAVTTPERGCEARGWCYAVMYGALDRGQPPEPAFNGNLLGADQDNLNREGWRKGVASGAQAVQDLKLRNRILLRVAYDHSDANNTLQHLWTTVAQHDGLEKEIEAYPSLTMDHVIGD